MEEANKLIGAGKKHLVTGKVVEAVTALQEACGILAKAYGDTADECAEAFFWCGKALLELARMENTVLGNALEGVPEDDDDEKPKDSTVEGTKNVDEKTRDELRVRAYDAMAEKAEGDSKCDVTGSKLEESEANRSELLKEVEGELEELADEEENAADKKVEEPADKVKEREADKKVEDPAGNNLEPSEKMEDAEADKVQDPADKTEPPPEKMEADGTDKLETVRGKVEDMADKVKPAEKMEEEPAVEEEEPAEGAEDGDEESGDDAEQQVEDIDAGEKESDDDDDEEEEEVGNLQLAWEMLEVAKVIYKRKESKQDQLMAAQAYLKLGEVSAESGNFTQALEDFQECLSLRLKHLDSDSRLLAETHYQLGFMFHLNRQYKEAIGQLKRSIHVIKSRLEKLTELIEKAAGHDELPEERKEMEELEALLPEIQEKMEDAADGLKMLNAEASKGVLDGASGSTGQSGDALTASSTNGSPSKVTAANAPVSDISHLVRKKRKPEESPVKEGAVKKVKQDDAQEKNGVHKANGDAEAH
ncbi:LOW QUALITY PROTEIN: histone-binding protein N1/N2-like [Phyllopteryx taeniolatus]|uniref:LOW QUALITY PROTEIN: histone-binding protein N1/N2-like n=1 Tax=Phyllopteryx taeniolatus TaxID=161469 RepID=UPI002AD22236|nr:LOW QUALITY PROTEIN: histone-binding protein N1/N2-like [Phyllopteryx taeniolatus]